MSIYLGRADAGVAQELLDYPEIRPIAQQVRGKGMPHEMGKHRFLYPGALRPFLDNLPDSVTGQFSPPYAQEHSGEPPPLH